MPCSRGALGASRWIRSPPTSRRACATSRRTGYFRCRQDTWTSGDLMTAVVIGDNTGNDFPGKIDTTLRMTNATTNYGSDAGLETTKYSPADHSHSLLRFPGLSNIPSVAIVSAATVRLYLSDETG